MVMNQTVRLEFQFEYHDSLTEWFFFKNGLLYNFNEK